jgi:hypothetical protein
LGNQVGETGLLRTATTTRVAVATKATLTETAVVGSAETYFTEKRPALYGPLFI